VHLVALERDGLIARSGLVRSGAAGQPAAEYELTTSGELALSSAYPAAMVALAGAIGDKFDVRSKRALFLEAGRRLAATMVPRDGGSLASKATACAELIESLGGSVSVTTARGSAVLEGAGCPLGAAVRSDPATCSLVEGMLERHTGVDAEMLCHHGDRPSCRFRLTS
jgi:predicted ArsR family transcriptional regulator